MPRKDNVVKYTDRDFDSIKKYPKEYRLNRLNSFVFEKS